MYWIEFVIEHKNMFDVDFEIDQALFDFMKYTDDFEHYDEFNELYRRNIILFNCEESDS